MPNPACNIIVTRFIYCEIFVDAWLQILYLRNQQTNSKKEMKNNFLSDCYITNLILQQCETPMHKNDVGNFNITLVEDMIATSWNLLKATRIRNWKISSNGRGAVVIVANPVVVATTAVQIPLHGIPFCSDKSVYAVPKISNFFQLFLKMI